MAKTPYSLLHGRLSRPLKLAFSPPLRSHSFSTISDPEAPLPARMRFVLDRIDAIEKERSCKALALQRIRVSRESMAKANNPPVVPKHDPPGPGPGPGPGPQIGISAATDSMPERREGRVTNAVELVHPWIEWLELLERLVQMNYFDYKRMEGPGGMFSGLDSGAGFDLIRDFKAVQTAFLNFGRDRFDIFRSLSTKDIQHLVGYGCPSDDRKVVFSSKLLRKYARLDEGDVCCSCSLKGSCVRAYLVTNKEDEARTFDVMRILLTLGFDPVNGYPANGSIVNKPLLKLKPLKTVVRKLLHKVVKLSVAPIDPHLPPPVIKKRQPKVIQQHPTPKKQAGRDDFKMKKGDWLCTECEFINFARNSICLECDAKRPKRHLLQGEWECPRCDFLNFAQNTICLACDAKRPNRQLLPGEWECPECNFLNYRRNMVCFQCECKRPPEYMETFKPHSQYINKMKLKRLPSRRELSNASNFNFDDADSDEAYVADFEYADHLKMDAKSDGLAEGRNLRYPENDFYEASCRSQRPQGRDLSYIDHNKSNIGFDDFDDEENDINISELDSQSSASVQKKSQNDFLEVKRSEDFEGPDNDLLANGVRVPSMHRREVIPDFNDDHIADSDADLPASPHAQPILDVDGRWKSSVRATDGPSKVMILCSQSDDALMVYPTKKLENLARQEKDADNPSIGMNFHSNVNIRLSCGSNGGDLHKDIPSERMNENKWDSGRRESSRECSDMKYVALYVSDSDDDDSGSPGNGFESGKIRLTQKGDSLNSCEYVNSVRDTQFNNMGGRRKIMDDDSNRSVVGSYGGQRFDNNYERNFGRDKSQRNTIGTDEDKGYSNGCYGWGRIDVSARRGYSCDSGSKSLKDESSHP